MKQIAKNLIVIGAMLAAGSAAGMELHPVLGIDYLQAWMPGTSSITTFTSGAGVVDAVSAKSAFRNSSPGGTLYIGHKFTECFGIELGWDSSFASRKKTVISPSSSPIAGGYRYTAKVLRTGFHGDLMGFLPMMNCWHLFGTLGWGLVEAKISSQSLVANNPASQATLDAGTALPFRGRKRSILRLGVGTSYMLTDMFGVRAKLGWEGTGDLRLRYNDDTSDKLFKDSTTLAVGLFVQF